MKPRRTRFKPLNGPAVIHAQLQKLHVGDTIPPQIYISDYQDGTIPSWQVAEIEIAEPVTVYTLIDPDAAWHSGHSLTHVAIDVFVSVTKILAGEHYGYFPGCEHARNMLHDIRQRARKMTDRWEDDEPDEFDDIGETATQLTLF